MGEPVFRRKSTGTKVSEEEYAKLEALAGCAMCCSANWTAGRRGAEVALWTGSCSTWTFR
jgi:hypothetical protein